MFNSLCPSLSPTSSCASRLTAVLAGLCLLALAPAAGAASRPVSGAPDLAQAPAVAGTPAGFEHAGITDDGRIQVMVELQDPPAAVVFAQAMAGAKPSDARARAAAGAASKAQVLKIEAAQEGVGRALAASPVNAREIYRVSKSLNGIAVAVDPQAVSSILKITGVKRVLPIVPEYPTNSTSVPFLGTPNVWANTIGLPAGADGTGIRIGVIDTGIDYMHGDFGGTGVLADYQTESTASVGFTTAGSFPTAKVVGGTDFAGDAYTGANAPLPDVNPMDCNGHGSHVSGTAAGFGVTAAGATFTGPYDANTSTYSGLRIGPGTAPKAKLYGLRVFGCAGSTGLTVLAIDWAMDPNGDNDLSDHLDVINMSLGSDFGSVLNTSAIASDNAALAGVIVVTSAGNSGDTFFISGAPGAASRALATAASVDSGVTAPAIKVNSPAGIAGFYTFGTAGFGSVPPPGGLTGNVVVGLDPADGAGPLTTDGCSPLTNAAAVAGNIALIDRGTCGFTVKVKNAQNAGAVGVVIANSSAGAFGGLGGADPTITIPSGMVTFTDGNTLKANIATLNVTLFPGSDTLASFSSRGPRRIYGAPLRLKPDIAAPGLNITSVQTGHTCMVAAGCTGLSDPSGFQAGNQTLTISGTSMASPHMAGIMALLRQLHPDWSVEELKALAMNYAVNKVTVNPAQNPPTYNLSRVGAGPGRSGQVGARQRGRHERRRRRRGERHLQPRGGRGRHPDQEDPHRQQGRPPPRPTTSRSTPSSTPPASSFSLPGGNSVTVPAGETAELNIQMSADSSQMDHTRDAALAPTQNIQANYGAQPVNFLTEEGAYLTFSQSAALKFRLPVYMAEKPSSMMTGPATIITGGAGTGSTTIPLSGIGLCSGTLAAGPTCTGTFPTDNESAVSPFELQVVSPLDPVNSTDFADIHYVGVSYPAGRSLPRHQQRPGDVRRGELG